MSILQSLTDLLDHLLGFGEGETLEAHFSFGAAWAQDGPAWVLFGCLALCGLTALFYFRTQQRAHRGARIWLTVSRSLLLCLLLLTLADPIRQRTYQHHPLPLFWVLIDGTDSMNIADELPAEDRARFGKAVAIENWLTSGAQGETTGLADASQNAVPAALNTAADVKPSRADYIRALFNRPDENLLEKLGEQFRVRTYAFNRRDGVTALKSSTDEEGPDPAALVAQIPTDGEVTALGAAFEDLALRHATSNLAGVLVISDFDQNSGRGPLEPARRLGVPVFTLGVGPRSAMDLSVDLQTPLKMKKAEQTTVAVTLRQQELTGQTVTVHVNAQRIGSDDSGLTTQEIIPVGQREVTLEASSNTVELPFRPEKTGRFLFTAEVEPLEGEIVDQNNTAQREVTIIDDFLRLLFVEHEPTWEWRFVKEVFHRDKLVGIRGFRTFLRSADPDVKKSNELFLPSLTQPRSEFFKYDVIFLGDMPASTLSTRFCEMTKEFVSQFGGGLVVMAGPRFGPGQLADTPLADMLPVIVDPDARMRDERAFRPELTPLAGQFDFMQLGEEPAESFAAWQNIGRVPWYQPVSRVEPSATTVLAEHPTDTCIDGKTKQPLIAIRKYGRGEVIYVAFNEMWRLRRLYGERYYRQFWGQMIHRLGLSHALGSQKRFVVRTDRQRYQADDKVLLTIEAYNEDFEPLDEEELTGKSLQARLYRPQRGSDGTGSITELSVSQLKPGIFEARIPVFESGEYRVDVRDPIAAESVEVHFEVASVSVERRSAVRNFALQENIASATSGKAYELDTVHSLHKEFQPPRLTEKTVEIRPLWNTWLWFTVIAALMLGEWFFRKMVHLA